MSITTCPVCLHETTWSWTEAFDKFGFSDGDGLVMTAYVANALRDHGYRVTSEPWGSHNTTITSIENMNGKQLIPGNIEHGYDDPRDYLPKRIIKLLDKAFPEDGEVEP